jgi:hypothetical protein
MPMDLLNFMKLTVFYTFVCIAKRFVLNFGILSCYETLPKFEFPSDNECMSFHIAAGLHVGQNCLIININNNTIHIGN